MGLVKTRRLAAMHPPSPRLRRTGKQQRAKAAIAGSSYAKATEDWQRAKVAAFGKHEKPQYGKTPRRK